MTEKNSGFTLIEVLVVVALFSVLFLALLAVLTNADLYWSKGQNKLNEQQEARRVISGVVNDLRRSNPNWDISGTEYPVAISENYTRIDFYQPVFYNETDSTITGLTKITYKIDTTDVRKLLRKSGSDPEEIISNATESIRFGGACPDCSTYNCTAVNAACPVVRVEVVTKEDNEFELVSDVALRNMNITLANDTEVIEPEEGEF
ncbi:MAG: type II secretion system protein [Candidatus Omnitrophica bacterium]|jgi:prepilin-type N-terminal cleavage/methylation domain-containing protein|nr:type II secretion system GspH family protein [Candidatus Omnitrophota bacterium]MDD5080303.1 type II secretion system protein [Candidatus Omnitrophota bacterium]